MNSITRQKHFMTLEIGKLRTENLRLQHRIANMRGAYRDFVQRVKTKMDQKKNQYPG